MNKPREEALFHAAAPTMSAAGVGVPHPHESAHLHVAGEATYVDDMPELAGTLHAAFGLSPVAHGHLKSIDLDVVRALPGVVDAFGADAIPGRNDCGPIVHCRRF
jgi:xanthine dehydrogenase large subunit